MELKRNINLDSKDKLIKIQRRKVLAAFCESLFFALISHFKRIRTFFVSKQNHTPALILAFFPRFSAL